MHLFLQKRSGNDDTLRREQYRTALICRYGTSLLNITDLLDFDLDTERSVKHTKYNVEVKTGIIKRTK